MKLSCSRSKEKSLSLSAIYLSVFRLSLLFLSSVLRLTLFSVFHHSSLRLSFFSVFRRCLSLFQVVVVSLSGSWSLSSLVSLLSLFLFLSLCSLLSVCLSEEHRRNPKKSPNSILKSGSGFFNFGSVFYNWAIYIS